MLSELVFRSSGRLIKATERERENSKVKPFVKELTFELCETKGERDRKESSNNSNIYRKSVSDELHTQATKHATCKEVKQKKITFPVGGNEKKDGFYYICSLIL